jgi:hypothetical protein
VSLVSTRLALTQRCTIERDANAATAGAWGTPSAPDWQSHITDVPCRVWATTGSETVANGTTVTPVEDVRVIVPLGTDVTDADRIASVTYRGGTAQDGPLGIRAMLARRDHLELVLVKV